MLISKSKFIAGTQCLKRLYLIVHSPELAVQPDELDESIIQQGREVGLLARRMFPGGVTVESKDREQAIRATRELIDNPEIPAIFEGAFEHREVFVRVDILQRRRDQRWRLIEVKSTADVKDHHLDDVAIQHRVVVRCGVDLQASCLAHVDREYVYEGGPIDAHRFFKIKNLTRQVERVQAELAAQLRSEFRVLAMSVAPAVAVGQHCTYPITCEFFHHCNLPLPEDHILRLPRVHASTVAKLAALGIQSIHEIPRSFPLSMMLRRACNSVRDGKPWFSPELRKELGRQNYPLYFMDFESLNPAIPRFASMRPYDSLLHRLRSTRTPHHIRAACHEETVCSAPRRDHDYQWAAGSKIPAFGINQASLVDLVPVDWGKAKGQTHPQGTRIHGRVGYWHCHVGRRNRGVAGSETRIRRVERSTAAETVAKTKEAQSSFDSPSQTAHRETEE